MAALPKTMQGCKWRAKKEGWVSREVKGSGGPGGIRTEYHPPADVLAQIHAFLDASPEYPRGHSADALVTGSGKQQGVKLQDHAHLEDAPEGFILVPRYDVAASMGNGSVIHSEQVVDHLAFRAEWVRTELGTSPKNLILISAIGDSMEPSLRAGDLLLIDRSVESVRQDAIYAIAHDGELRIKRIQRLFDGTLIIKSDNPKYQPENITPEQAERMRIVGRVVWSGRRM